MPSVYNKLIKARHAVNEAYTQLELWDTRYKHVREQHAKLVKKDVEIYATKMFVGRTKGLCQVVKFEHSSLEITFTTKNIDNTYFCFHQNGKVTRYIVIVQTVVYLDQNRWVLGKLDSEVSEVIKVLSSLQGALLDHFHTEDDVRKFHRDIMNVKNMLDNTMTSETRLSCILILGTWKNIPGFRNLNADIVKLICMISLELARTSKIE